MSIKFNNKQTTVDNQKIYSIEIYRGSDDKDNQRFSYIDSMHPMNISELQKLKNYLSELIWEEFND
jgi:CRISPR/Cas system CMR-associated protein Cmr3 (group 5 of RAMP superfamily)